MIILLLTALLAQDWVYDEDGGFVAAGTDEHKSAPELLQHGISLRDAEDIDGALAVLDLMVDTLPEGSIREEAHHARLETYLKGELYQKGVEDCKAFVSKYPQSDQAAAAKRLEMECSLALAYEGAPVSFLGLFTLYHTSETGIECLKDALQRYPREDCSAEFYYRLGGFYFESEDYDAAELEYTTVVDLYSDAPVMVQALFMLGRTNEARFRGIDYEDKPLRDSRRSYARIVEEADRMRALSDQARAWVDENLPDVQSRIADIDERLAAKEMQTADYYRWKGLSKSAAISYRAILRKYPKTRVAAEAQADLDALTP